MLRCEEDLRFLEAVDLGFPHPELGEICSALRHCCCFLGAWCKPIRLSGALGPCRQRIRARPNVCVLLVALLIRHPCYVGTLKLSHFANWRTFP
jgi:hypothetical protein